MKTEVLKKYITKINSLSLSGDLVIRNKLILALHVQENINFQKDVRWIKSTYVSPNGNKIQYTHLVLR